MHLRHHIQTIAATHTLPWELVYAICVVESSLDPYAIRYEPNYKYLTADQVHLAPTERIGQMCSWGIMQVMGAVAREHGFTYKYFSKLCDPTEGLTYGCLHLAKYKAKYQQWPDAIAAYNAGSPRRALGPDGPYMNQFYVDKVIREWQKLEHQIPLKESEV